MTISSLKSISRVGYMNYDKTPPIPDVWMRLTRSEDVLGNTIGNYDGITDTNSFGDNWMSSNNTVTIQNIGGRDCAYLTENGYIKFPSGILSKFCVTCYVYIDSNTTDYSRLLKLSGENGRQGSADITINRGIVTGNNVVYDDTLSTWVHLKINFDVNVGNTQKQVFINDVEKETYTISNPSLNTANFVIGQQDSTRLKSKFYMYDFKLYRDIHL